MGTVKHRTHFRIKKENVKMNNSNHIGNMNKTNRRSMIEWQKTKQKLKS